MENRAFYPEVMQPPLGAYAHGVEVPENAKLTFVAGQVGIDFEGNLPDDFESQARNAWANCIAVLEHNRLRIGDVVKIPAYSAVRAGFLGENRPTSTLLVVAGLADPKFLVEVEMIAAATDR